MQEVTPQYLRDMKIRMQPLPAAYKPEVMDKLKAAPSLWMAACLSRVYLANSGTLYAGTVPYATITRRRKANKASRLSRRKNRGR